MFPWLFFIRSLPIFIAKRCTGTGDRYEVGQFFLLLIFLLRHWPRISRQTTSITYLAKLTSVEMLNSSLVQLLLENKNNPEDRIRFHC